MSSVDFLEETTERIKEKAQKEYPGTTLGKKKFSPVCHFRQVNPSMWSLKAPSKNGG